ncbi:class I SAM-dependent methyltransferase [Bradyrhizobium sp. MOS001]|uniref:class I SAM-dependent methyltransferase n=1 Tax=Bradyrhizobium sp. MOS001 TaxID=2133948 RepID=UPI001074C39F|nr:class I SAM-dependent methyltransferase [Bradyrhizobium sp. MOS001]TFW61132.1 class I SAM-dependent methyltransferase [Bradyrhizobium sp. MOS001]
MSSDSATTPSFDRLDPALFSKLRAQLYPIYVSSFGPIAGSQHHLDRMTDDSLDVKRSIAQLSLFEKESGRSPRGLKLLEVGAGLGLTIATARLHFGAEAYGLEPGGEEFSGTYELGQQLLEGCGLDPRLLVNGVGEQIPFPDQSFDAVISSNVLEHVADPAAVMKECFRVLRPGGVCHMVIPNFGSWWEGHYGLLWLPHSPHWLGRLRVRLAGRNPSYVDTLQLITPGKMKHWIEPFSEKIEVRGWGQALFEDRVRSLNFEEYSTLGLAKDLLRVCHRLGVISFLLGLARIFRWETPIVLTFVKTS